MKSSEKVTALTANKKTYSILSYYGLIMTKLGNKSQPDPLSIVICSTTDADAVAGGQCQLLDAVHQQEQIACEQSNGDYFGCHTDGVPVPGHVYESRLNETYFYVFVTQEKRLAQLTRAK